MNRKPGANWRTSNVTRLTFVCVAIHLVIDFLLSTRTWVFNETWMVCAVALPLSQCSLATVWAMTHRGNIAIRFATPAMVTVGCWFVLNRIIGWGMGEPASAAWAMLLVLQMACIVIVIHFHQPAKALIACCVNGAGKESEDVSDDSVASPFAFNMQTMLMWLTALACGFGFIRYGRDHWRWDSSVGAWEYLNAMPMLGSFNALLAVVWLWVCSSRRWWVVKLAVTMTTIPVTMYLLPHLMEWATGNRALETRELTILTAVQSGVLITTFAAVLFADSRDHFVDNVSVDVG